MRRNQHHYAIMYILNKKSRNPERYRPDIKLRSRHDEIKFKKKSETLISPLYIQNQSNVRLQKSNFKER